MEKTKCNMHQKAGIGPRVQKKAACKRGMENYFPAHCLPLWEVRYPLLEQAGQQAHTQWPLLWGGRLLWSEQNVEGETRSKNWCFSPQLHSPTSHSPTPQAACDEHKGWNQLCQSWEVCVAGICNKHLLCMMSCDLSWQILNLFINTGKETSSDSQLGKERNKSCCSELWFRWSNSASLIMQLLAFRVIYGKSEFEQTCWVCSRKGREWVFIYTYTPP